MEVKTARSEYIPLAILPGFDDSGNYFIAAGTNSMCRGVPSSNDRSWQPQ